MKSTQACSEILKARVEGPPVAEDFYSDFKLRSFLAGEILVAGNELLNTFVRHGHRRDLLKFYSRKFTSRAGKLNPRDASRSNESSQFY